MTSNRKELTVHTTVGKLRCAPLRLRSKDETAAARLDSAEVRKVGSTPLVIALLAPAGDGQ